MEPEPQVNSKLWHDDLTDFTKSKLKKLKGIQLDEQDEATESDFQTAARKECYLLDCLRFGGLGTFDTLWNLVYNYKPQILFYLKQNQIKSRSIS